MTETSDDKTGIHAAISFYLESRTDEVSTDTLKSHQWHYGKLTKLPLECGSPVFEVAE